MTQASLPVPATEGRSQTGAATTGLTPSVGLASLSGTTTEVRNDRRRTLMATLRRGDPDEPLRRLELARLQLADGLAGEAQASLAAGDPAPADLASSNAVSGAADMLLGRLDAAGKALADPGLDPDRETLLWRAVVAAGRGDPGAAVTAWPEAARVLWSYPSSLRLRLGLPLAQAALDAGRVDLASALLNRLDGNVVSAHDHAAVALARAAALARDGRIEAAQRLWQEVAASGDMAQATSARFAAIQARSALGRLSYPAAETALLAERPFWRGHPDDAAMMGSLAETQARAADWGGALATWRHLQDRHPADRRLAAAPTAMRRDLAAAMDAAAAGTMSPVRGLALAMSWPQLLRADDRADLPTDLVPDLRRMTTAAAASGVPGAARDFLKATGVAPDSGSHHEQNGAWQDLGGEVRAGGRDAARTPAHPEADPGARRLARTTQGQPRPAQGDLWEEDASGEAQPSRSTTDAAWAAEDWAGVLAAPSPAPKAGGTTTAETESMELRRAVAAGRLAIAPPLTRAPAHVGAAALLKVVDHPLMLKGSAAEVLGTLGRELPALRDNVTRFREP